MATKVETRQKDIECRLNMRELVELEGRANHLMKSAIDRSIASGLDPRYDTVKRYVEDRIAAGIKANAASLSYHKIPKERQEWLAEAGKKCNDLSYVISGMLPILSGDREVHVSLGKSRSVFCGTSPGDKYSKSCKYTKKDGRVHMKLTAEDLVGLMDPANCDIQRLSQADGLPLISVERMTDGVHSCRWVKKSRGFSVEVVSGWIASYRSTCFHSTKSWGHALSGLTRKLKGMCMSPLADPEQITRRMVRQATGWCGPGVQAWIDKYIPDEYKKSRSVPRGVVIEAAKKDTSAYGQQLIALLTK